MRLFTFLPLGSMLIVASACGGATGSDDLFSGATFSGASTTDAGTSKTPTPGDGDPADAGTAPDATSSSQKDSGGGGGGGGGGGTKKDAGGSNVDDASAPVDAGNPNGDPGIPCGAVYCTLKTQQCCADSLNDPSGATYACQSAGSVCAAGTPITCDNGAECNGEICCGTFSQTTGYKSVMCQPTCTSTSATDEAIRFCDPSVVPDECAAIGKTCKASASLVGYNRCE